MKRKSFITIFISCMLLVFSLALASCKGKVKVLLSNNELSINENSKTVTLFATVTGSEGEVEWSIDKEGVATIETIGAVCMISPVEAGEATITAKVGKASDSCALKVVATPESEKVAIQQNGASVKQITVIKGETLAFTATASRNSPVYWQTVNHEIATVNENGVVTGVGVGTTKLIAATNTVARAEVIVHVRERNANMLSVDGGAEAYAVNHPGFWVEWHDQNWLGSNVTVTSATQSYDGVAHLEYSSTGSCWYGMQLFYEVYSNKVGSEYTLSMKINSSVAGKITVNGTVVQLSVGDNNVSVTYVEQDYLDDSATGAGVSVIIQFGSESGGMISGGSFAISNMTMTENVADE